MAAWKIAGRMWLMDKVFTVKVVLGHLARVLTPVLAWLLVKLGVDAAGAEGMAAEVAPSAAALIGFIGSAAWSYASRKKLLGQEPPVK